MLLSDIIFCMAATVCGKMTIKYRMQSDYDIVRMRFDSF